MTVALEAEGLSHAHPGGFRLEGVSLQVQAGEGVAVAGPNGAGKSTLLKLLAGVLAPDGGRVSAGGKDLTAMAPRERARLVAWVPQEMDAAFPISVEAFVALGFFPRSRWAGWAPAAGEAGELERLLDLLSLTAFRRRDIGELSGGERRRALLARGLAQSARVLLLDEPTAHMDPARQKELLAAVERLRAAGVAVVSVFHDLNAAREACSRLVLMKEGRAIHDGPSAAVPPAALEEAYGLPAEVGPGFIRFP